MTASRISVSKKKMTITKLLTAALKQLIVNLNFPGSRTESTLKARNSQKKPCYKKYNKTVLFRY